MIEKLPCITWSSRLVPYKTAWDMQLERIGEIAGGKANATLFFLEHPPVITIGKTGKDEHVLLPEPALKIAGIDCIRTNRGGDVTFHGPGQLVVYLMIPLTGADRDVHGFLRKVENVGIKVLSDFGITASRYTGYTGVWIDDKKIMAVGIGVKKWVTFHGLAFNYNNELDGFNYIVPCGIKDRGVVSLHHLLKREVTREEIEERFRQHLSCEFNLELAPAVDPT